MIVYQALKWYWGPPAQEGWMEPRQEVVAAVEPPVTDELEGEFENACNEVARNADKVPSADILYLYARYKQATSGPANPANRPSMYDLTKRRKFDAWLLLKNMSQGTAMREYISKVSELFTSADLSRSSNSGGFGIRPSVLMQESETEDEELLTPEAKLWFAAVYEEKIPHMDALLDENPKRLELRNGNGITALHYAADRGKLTLVAYFLDKGANVNALDEEGQTPLHYAVSCGHNEVVAKLLSAGADPTIATYEGLCSLDVATDQAILDLLEHAVPKQP